MPQFTNEYSMTISQIDPTTMSTWVAPLDSILRPIKKTNIRYGLRHWTRPLSDPEKTVNISLGFVKEAKGMEKLVQSLDLACISKRNQVDFVEASGDPQNVQNHISAFGEILMGGLEALFMSGASDPVVRGVLDYPNGTAGTLNRPEAIAPVTGGNWHTEGVMRQNVIEAIANMTGKGFYGKKALVIHPLTMVMLAEVISGTGVGLNEWVSSKVGIPVIQSAYVDTDATKSAFDAVVIDVDRVGIGATPVLVNAFSSNEQHAEVVDGEVYATPYFDPINDGTEWLKGVCKIAACSWVV